MSGPRVLVAGAGFAGLAMGIRLAQAGFHDFEILERSERVGGTWRDNAYPGAACDVESHLYSYSFEPNPRWSRRFAAQPEILAYLERCAEKYDLRPHLRLGTAVTGAEFDEHAGEWLVRATDGLRRARVLVSATGGLSVPKVPEIPGLASFAGPRFHSARWDAAARLDGRVVGVVGTGASAVQIVPALAGAARRVVVFQRTPPWVVPRRDRAIGALEQALYARVPALQRLARAAQYLRHELLVPGFVWEPRLLELLGRLAARHLERQVPDPALREKLRPRYVMGCKRVLLSDDWYPALCRPDVALVTEAIDRVEPQGVRTADGRLHRLDALVLATGFEAAEALPPFEVRGRGGRTLAQAWRDGPEACLGTAVAGFPNLFLLVGPNTGLGHSSMVYMIESQVAWAVDAVRALHERPLRFVDALPAAQARWNALVQRRLRRSVWETGGCASWYRTRAGRNTTLWPGFTFEYRWRTRRFDAAAFECVPAEAPRVAPGPLRAGRSGP